jgi:NAD(P)-dependent dehydrogenase (short-subunit alcohol dehydrogenase family)
MGRQRVETALAGKVVVVTGGAGGIGKACARRFLEEEAAVFVADASQDRLKSAVKELSAASGSLYPTQADGSGADHRRRPEHRLWHDRGLRVLVSRHRGLAHTRQRDLWKGAATPK